MFYQVRKGLECFGRLGVLLNADQTTKTLLFDDGEELRLCHYRLAQHTPIIQHIEDAQTLLEGAENGKGYFERQLKFARRQYWRLNDSPKLHLALRLNDADEVAHFRNQLEGLERRMEGLEKDLLVWVRRLELLRQEIDLRELYELYARNKPLPKFSARLFQDAKQLTLNL